MVDTLLNETIKQGIDLLDKGNTKEAVKILEGYWKDNKNVPDSWFYLGDALAEDGQLSDAIDRYREGLKLAPDDADALTTLGDMLLENGKHKDAIGCYKKVLDIDPKDADAMVSIGLVYNIQERSDDAIRAFRQALEIEPENVFAWNALGDALYGQGDVEGAVNAFGKGIDWSRRPCSTSIWANRTMIWKNLKVPRTNAWKRFALTRFQHGISHWAESAWIRSHC
jgi:Flp pilus assembly protein TadD